MHRLRHGIARWTGPPWPRTVRFGLALAVAVIAFICKHFRLTSAHGFAVIGFAVAAVVLLTKALLWKRTLAGQAHHAETAILQRK